MQHLAPAPGSQSLVTELSTDRLNKFCIEKYKTTGYVQTQAAAAAKSLQSCPTLCDPRDGIQLIAVQHLLILMLSRHASYQGRAVWSTFKKTPGWQCLSVGICVHLQQLQSRCQVPSHPLCCAQFPAISLCRQIGVNRGEREGERKVMWKTKEDKPSLQDPAWMNFWQHTYSTKKRPAFFLMSCFYSTYFRRLCLFQFKIQPVCWTWVLAISGFKIAYTIKFHFVCTTTFKRNRLSTLSIKEPFPAPTPINVWTVKFEFHGPCFLFKAPFVLYKTASFSKINISYDCS